MKLNEIQIGGRYTAKVSGQIQVVRVTAVREVSAFRSGHAKTVIDAVNDATGRRITIRSPQRLRQRVDQGCEFCRQAFNRPAGEFTCPYCRTAWKEA